MKRSGASQPLERMARVVALLVRAGFPMKYIDVMIREHIGVEVQNIERRRRHAECN